MSNQALFWILAGACVVAFIALVAYEERNRLRAPKWRQPKDTASVVGYDVVAPVLAAAIALADDGTEGEDQRARRFQIHRWEMQMALSEYAEHGGTIPRGERVV